MHSRVKSSVMGLMLAVMLAVTGGATAIADPSISVSDAVMLEGSDAGELAFQVSLSAPSIHNVFFSISTRDGTARGTTDYLPTGYSNVMIPAGQTSVTVVVPVQGDTNFEVDEYFVFYFNGAYGATFDKSQATGRLLNDDGTMQVSIPGDPTSTMTNGHSHSPSVSEDGRFVAFVSQATNIVNGSGTQPNVYVRDTYTDRAVLASVGVGPVATNGSSAKPRISADGRYVVFESTASNLVQSDPNGAISDVFLRDIQAGTTTLVSVAASGATGANQASTDAVVSADGRRVAFASTASNLVASDPSGAESDVFLRNMATGVTTLLSLKPNGLQSGGSAPAISADGRYVAFETSKSLLPGDTDLSDVYLRDLETGTLSRISATPAGTSPDGGSHAPALSADGRKVLFTSRATNLVVGMPDSNNAYDVFVRDIVTGQTTIASLDASGALVPDGVACGTCPPTLASISGDGTHVGFVPRFAATADDQNSASDVYIRNLASRTTTRASAALRGGANTGGGFAPSLSGNGQFVAFASTASDLVVGDRGFTDVFIAGRTGTFSNNALLSGLNTNLGALDPIFSVGTRSYAQSTPAESVIFGVNTQDDNTTLAIRGVPTLPGGPTPPFALVPGANVFPVVVTAQDGVSTQTTNVTITRTTQILPLLSLGSASVSEGDSGTKLMTFTASLSAPSTGPVTFSVSSHNGSATAGSDYVAIDQTMTIPAGSTSQTFTVTILGDTVLEPDEQFNVRIYDEVGTKLGGVASAPGTIVNDELGATPAISIADLSLPEGDSETRTFTFTISLSVATNFPVTYSIITQRGSAMYPYDFLFAEAHTQTIPAGSTSATFNVTVNGDTEVETDETILVNLYNIVGASRGDIQAFGWIRNDDTPGMPSLSIGSVTLSEGDAGTKLASFPVRLSAPASGPVTYNIATADRSAHAGTDYAAASLVGETIPAGVTTKTFTVTVNGDTAVEATEVFDVVASGVVGASNPMGYATGTITDDDSGGNVPTLSISGVSVSEGNADSKNATFTISLSSPTSVAVSYSIATANAGAAAPDDFIAQSLVGESIPAGTINRTFTVQVRGDTEIETDEDFFVRVSSVVGATVSIGQAQGTIRNDDAENVPIALLDTDQYLWMVPPASSTHRQGFIRLSNRQASPVQVSLWGLDSSGRRSLGTVTTTLLAYESRQLNSTDLELGSTLKGFAGSIGEGGGDWTVIVRSSGDVEASAFIRTTDGFLTSMHDRVDGDGVDWFVPIFNPADNPNQVSHLRIVNTNLSSVDVIILGVDDAGATGASEVLLSLAPLSAVDLTSSDLENGNPAKGLTGKLGNGSGKWHLSMSSTGRITVQSQLADRLGMLTNLSTVPDLDETPTGEKVIWMLPPASNLQQQGFVRLINRENRAGTVALWGIDDAGQRSPGTITISLAALESRQLNSQDLEHGNPAKGMTGSLGDGIGNWRLMVLSDLDLIPMALIRTPDGFLTTIHETLAGNGLISRVPMFNPADNPNQVSVLRIVNPGTTTAAISIRGTADLGHEGGLVSLGLAPGAAIELTSTDLENGSLAKGLSGRLGSGEGKWALTITASVPIKAQNLLRDPRGYLTNLSTTPKGSDANLNQQR